MRVALITDQHWGVRNGSKFFLDNYEKFYEQVFFPTLDEMGIKHLWILGDFWEYRTRVDTISLYRAQKIFIDDGDLNISLL
jgi:hypothetical protein